MLEGKIALVTGASSGIGLAVARAVVAGGRRGGGGGPAQPQLRGGGREARAAGLLGVPRGRAAPAPRPGRDRGAGTGGYELLRRPREGARAQLLPADEHRRGGRGRRAPLLARAPRRDRIALVFGQALHARLPVAALHAPAAARPGTPR